MLSRILLTRPLGLIAASALALASGVAQASTFGVRVVDALGVPVQGAAVCIGIEGNYRQFGAMFTDRKGAVLTDVPNVPLVVTVSTNRFTGIRLYEPPRGFNLIREVTLRDGVPGPRCRAESSYAAAEISGMSELELLGYTASTHDGRLLFLRARGEPNEYRIGTDETLANVAWQRYDGQARVPADIADAGALYLQVRRARGTPNAFIEQRSEIIRINRSAVPLN